MTVIYNSGSSTLVFYNYEIKTGKQPLNGDMEDIIDNNTSANKTWEQYLNAGTIEICTELNGSYYTQAELKELKNQEASTEATDTTTETTESTTQDTETQTDTDTSESDSVE